MVGAEQTRVGRVVSTFCKDKWNSILENGFGVERKDADFSSSELFAEMSEKNCNVYTVQKMPPFTVELSVK